MAVAAVATVSPPPCPTPHTSLATQITLVAECRRLAPTKCPRVGGVGGGAYTTARRSNAARTTAKTSAPRAGASRRGRQKAGGSRRLSEASRNISAPLRSPSPRRLVDGWAHAVDKLQVTFGSQGDSHLHGCGRSWGCRGAIPPSPSIHLPFPYPPSSIPASLPLSTHPSPHPSIYIQT